MPSTLRDDLRKKLANGEFHCEKELTKSIISGKYKVVILWHLGHDGPMRYGEIHRLFRDISNRILTKQLRELEQDDIVDRTIYPESPPHVEYRLTDRGRTLVPVVDVIYGWGCANIDFYRRSM